MKWLTFALLLLLATITTAQDYSNLVAEGEKLYASKDFALSAIKYKEAFIFQKNNASDLYNASCSAALSGDAKTAMEWLQLSFKNGWINSNHMTSDSDLSSLHGTKEWNNLVTEMQNEAARIEASYDQPLKAELIQIFNEDQAIRYESINAANQYGYESAIVDSLDRIMIYRDSLNLIKVVNILETRGWVGADKVGGQANQTLFLVIQHADLATQQKYLPMMRDAVKKGNAEANSLALLEDRVALGEGRKQIYGSQIRRNEKKQTFYVLPLEDPDNVDKRRAEVGLSPMAEYVKNWDITWDVEAYKKQLPEIEALEKR
jgi:hypothetical protein